MQCKLTDPSLMTENWALLEQKFGNEYPSIVGNVTINFFKSVLENRTHMLAMDCQHDTPCQEPTSATENICDHNGDNYMECDMGMAGGLLSQEQFPSFWLAQCLQEPLCHLISDAFSS